MRTGTWKRCFAVAVLSLVTGDREKELLGRYDESAYPWRMMKIVGHQEIELRELTDFDHGGMAEPAFPLLREFTSQRTGPDARR